MRFHAYYTRNRKVCTAPDGKWKRIYDTSWFCPGCGGFRQIIHRAALPRLPGRWKSAGERQKLYGNVLPEPHQAPAGNGAVRRRPVPGLPVPNRPFPDLNDPLPGKFPGSFCMKHQRAIQSAERSPPMEKTPRNGERFGVNSHRNQSVT